LNAPDIIGFPQLRPVPRFELIAELHQQRQAEIARITEIAARLTKLFGAETAVGFLYYEILGRLPNPENLLGYTQRLRSVPSTAPAIVDELFALAHSESRNPA
jgi:hypothetical protein